MHNSATATPLPELSEPAHLGTASAPLLDVFWLTVKEAAIAALIGAAVSVSRRAWSTSIYSLLCNPTFTTLQRIQAASMKISNTAAEWPGRNWRRRGFTYSLSLLE
jgi:hypothetical protein